jgi:choline-sulfatase
MAGVPVPAVVQGKSLVPVLGDQKRTLYPAVCGYFRDVQRMIRTDRWKLIYYPQLNRYQLFDLDVDPYELKDLSGDPQHAATLIELRSKLAAWRQEVGDPLLKKE